MTTSSAPGPFLVLDGVDGAGKTTQLDLLEAWLRRAGHDVVRCRDPGGTPAGERIRELILDPNAKMGMPAETLLYLASRAELVESVIRPALAAGRTVLCDRYESATLAYQGYAGGIDVEAIRSASKLARGDCVPDWIGVLDLPPVEAAARRAAERPADRIERRAPEYHQAVREGFRREAALDPTRYSIVDASGAAAVVHAAVVAEVQRVLQHRRS